MTYKITKVSISYFESVRTLFRNYKQTMARGSRQQILTDKELWRTTKIISQDHALQ